MLGCAKFVSAGGEFVVKQVVELLWARPLVVLYNMSVAGVRGVWHLHLCVVWRYVGLLSVMGNAGVACMVGLKLLLADNVRALGRPTVARNEHI